MDSQPVGRRPIGLQKPKRDNKWRYRTRRLEQDIHTDHTPRGVDRRAVYQNARLALEALRVSEGEQPASDAVRAWGGDLAEAAVNKFNNACKSVIRPGEKRREEIRAILLRYVEFAAKRGWQHGHRRAFVRQETQNPSSPMWDKADESQERILRIWIGQATRGDFGVVPRLYTPADDREAA